jgi:integrase
VEFGRAATLHIRRAKNGKSTPHPLLGEEQRAFRELRRLYPDARHVFMTERQAPFTTEALNRHAKWLAERAGFTFPVHFKSCATLAVTRALQNWLGHKSIQHTVRHSELAPSRFKNFWRE